MPIKLGEIRKSEKVVTVEFEDIKGTLNVRYNPKKMTPTQEISFKDAASRGEDTQAVVDLLAMVLVGWDLIGDDGKALPTTREVLLETPSGVLMAVLNAITAAARPDPTKASS